MEKRPLGRTDLQVSKICLGTMTFGEQNTEEEAHAQLDLAVDRGVNFIDTAEVYPVPMNPETQGRTEQYIGSWLKARGKRDDLVIATKVAGSRMAAYLREGEVRLDRANILAAVDASLARLQTDYIDLYQLHWPDSATNFFGPLNYVHQPDVPHTPLEETLDALGELVRAGKVRHVGLSNETPWGAMHALGLSEKGDLPRPVSTQNPYSLLNRTFEVGLSEVAHREQLGLLAYSPLGFGVLSGKYLKGARPEKARVMLFKQYGRYTNERGVQATERYVALARARGLSPVQMALSFVTERPFVTSNIIGATSVEQLEENLGSAELTLDDGVLGEIEAIATLYSNPCP
jgi:aryl-alcohol dehydrogenase-like predicted oxidoreductase